MAEDLSFINGDDTNNEMSRLTIHDPLVRSQSGHLGKVNGLTEGMASRSGSTQLSILGSENRITTMSFSREQQITILHETTIKIRHRFVTDFNEVEESHVDGMTIEAFLEYIEHQRLTHMPHRGNYWDKVLKWAEFFALQISGFATAVEPFISDSKMAARLIWIAARALLQLGPDNAKALEPTFGVFYHLGLSLSLLLRDSTLLAADGEIRLEVGQTLNDLLMLVSQVSIHYRVKAYGESREKRFDFYDAFGQQLVSFHQRKNHIIDSMWQYSLGNAAQMDVRALRKWLGPRDRTLQRLIKDDDFAPGKRDEYTCEWFQSHLLAFSRSKDDTLLMYGPAGCGKSVLSTWIFERLQRPLGKKSYVTLSCTVEADTPSEATSLAVAKRLLLQLLEKSIGNQALFQSLVKAYNVSMSKDAKRLENILWDSLDIGIQQYRDIGHVMVIVDGLDDVQSNQDAPRISDRLGLLAAKHSNVQVIATCRNTSFKSTEGKTRPFEITPDHVHEDLRLVIEHYLRDFRHFRDLSEHSREDQVEQVLHAAKGNFLWAIFTAFFLKQEQSADSFKKAVKAAKDGPKSLDEVIKKISNNLDYSKPDCSLLLSIMLVAERPLTTVELKYLLQVDLQKKHSVERKTNIVDDIKAALGPLVVIEKDFVRFCHPTVRSHMLRIQDEAKRLPRRQIAQSDLAMRLVAYCNFNLHRTLDAAFELMSKSEVDHLLSRHALLEYAVRTWTLHFQSSTFYRTKGELQLSDDFKAIFPSTTQLTMLEWACWGSETSRFEIIETHELALRVRESIFSDKHVCVLQSLIVCGNVWRETTETTEAAGYFFRASVIGQHILNKYHMVIAACTTTFLTITETMTMTTRTELVNRKEEMLTYIIEMYKYQHSETHDLVIRYYKVLAQLYVEIHEEHKAETVWRKLREIVIVRFGKGSEEETSISENLTIIIKKSGKKTDVVEYEQGIFDIVGELEVWNIRRIKLTIELALSYEARGEFLLAEELYVFLWRKITERCHHIGHHHGIEIHIHLMEVIIEYVRFLRRCHRHEEASSVLICIWTEYEDYEFESETLFVQLKIIGELMRSVSLLSVAVSVFKRCWGWFKAHSVHEHISSCEILISETMEEIIRTTSTTTLTTTLTTTSSTETVIKEVFESTMSRTSITSETISTCKSLISYYMKMEKWTEAIEVTKRSLVLIWKSVIYGGGTIALPREFGAGAIDIAINLAICHHQSQHFHEAEEIYVRIYRACRNSCHIDDERLIKTYKVLIRFYEEHRHWHKMIEIYSELLVEYRAQLGASHSLTIRTLYILGGLCSDHGHGHAHEYYEEIITVLNRGSHVCHADALDAMFFMCRYRYEAGHWHKLQTICKILWETWRGRHHAHGKFSADFIEVLYLRYRYVLEYHVHCEYSVLRNLTIEYRESCLGFFGATVAITIKAMIELAQICMRSEKYIHEAITIYEEVLTHTKTTTTTTTTTVVSTTTITTIKQQLTEAYTSVCQHETVSTTVIERAIKFMFERYESLRITVGWAHTETLFVLREIVSLHLKLKRQESITVVRRLVCEAAIQIIVSEKRSKMLHESGRAVGRIFLSCGMTDLALEVIEEIRLQIITGTASSYNKHGVKIDKLGEKVSFVFLVTLEQVVRGELSISYSEVMADYLTESVLYESYTLSVRSSTTTILGHAARLWNFLNIKRRYGQREVLENQSYDIFVKKWAINARSKEIGLLFYISLLIHIGDSVREVHVGSIACASSIVEVRRLLGKGQVHQAYEVAECALDFINHQLSYHQLQNVPHGFKLSALMAGRGVEQLVMAKVDAKLREDMLHLSRKIIREVLKACKDSKVDFVRLQSRELNDLVGLLGEQQNFADLEWILELLWKSREVQKKWKSDTIVSIGRRFVQARYLNASKERRSEAIRLCEDICYNLRRVWGSLDPKTLEMSNLLSKLYTNMGHHREAQGLHENILRLVVEGDDGDDRTLDTMSSADANRQVELLKQSYLRLKGWDKSVDVYVELIDELKNMPQYRNRKEWRELVLPNQWSLKESPSETLGIFVPPKQWEFVAPDSVTEHGEIKDTPRRSGMGMKRATSNWGLGLMHRFLHGDHHHGHEHVNSGPTSNGNGERNSVNTKPLVLEDDDGYESASEEATSTMRNGAELVH